MALPAEIIISILLNIAEDGGIQPYLLCPNVESERNKSLHACCLVNRSWYAQSIRVLYSRFKYKSDEHSFAKLWHFLRTIVEKPELGALVKHLDLRDHSSFDAKRREEVSHQEQPSSQCEIRRVLSVGADLGLKRLDQAFHTQEPVPYMTLLMACLPNVFKLHLSEHYSDYDHEDNHFHFDKPILKALDESNALQHLTEATLFDSHVVSDGETIGEWLYPSVSLRGIETLFLKSSIRKLELFDFESSCMPVVSDQTRIGTSNVTHLTLTCSGNLPVNIFDNSGLLKACIQLPKALVSLTLFLQTSTPGDPTYMIPHGELWHVLCQHKHNLEYLDLYDDDVTCGQIQPDFNRKPPMGKLQEFDRLTTLRIQPEMLLGGVSGILRVPYRFRDALPPSLHSLTLYNFCDIRALVNGKDLQTEIYQILTDTTIFNKLNFLIIDDLYEKGDSVLGEGLCTRMNAVQRVCNHRDIIFMLVSKGHLPQGGRNFLRYPEAYDPEEYALHTWETGIDDL